MKRFMFVAACASVIVGTLLASTQAQPQKARVSGLDRLKMGPKFANPDLAVVEFMGVLRGSNYVLGGKVTNVGNAAYTRSHRSGAFEGRTLQLFAIQNGGLGKGGSSKLLRTFSVPSLKAKESFATPTIMIPTREVPGSATAHFLLKLSGSDVDTSNDWKQLIVSPVN